MIKQSLLMIPLCRKTLPVTPVNINDFRPAKRTMRFT